MEIIAYDLGVHKNKKLIVYGIGEMGYITSRCLQKLNVSVYRYADRNASYHALFGKVISAEEMVEICEKEGAIVLFSVMGYARKEVEYLYQNGITRIYSVRKLWKAAELNSMEWNTSCKSVIDDADTLFFTEDTIASPGGLYLYSLDVVVTERCSLKCKDCSNLMQYYQHPLNMDVFEIKNAVDTLLRKDCRIFELRILGGEPLMNKEFVRIVDWYKEEERINWISIFSNATIFPDASILEHLKGKKTYVRMSDYGALSYKLEEWVQWCKENNVRYEVKKMDKWHDCGKLERHDYCEQELLGIYGGCECRNLPTVKEGYLYNCPYAANAAALGAMTIEERDRDRLLLLDSVSGDEIDRFLYERRYLEACRYCKGRNYGQAEIAPYVQTRYPLAYERLSDLQPADMVQSGHSVKETGGLVSVVIPAYNMEKYIERCLSSVLRSSYQNIEVIVVDDGSQDDTVKLCREIAEQDAFGRVSIIENKHAGVVQARNTGILSAKGKYITFVDADDYIDDQRLASMAEAVVGCDLLCAGYTAIYEGRLAVDSLMDRGQCEIEVNPCPIPEGVYEGNSLWAFIRRNFRSFCHGKKELGYFLWNYMFRADLLKKVCGVVDPTVWSGEDLVLSQIYSVHCDRIAVVNNLGYYYCYRSPRERYSGEGSLANMEKVYYCLHKEFKKHPKAELLETLIQEEYAELLLCGLALQGKNPQISTRNIYYPYYGRLKGKRVILYGAGNVGKAYYRHMKDDMECSLVAWVDKNAEKIRESDFLLVEGIESLYSKEYDYIIIAVFDEVVFQSIRRELTDVGIREEAILWNPTKYEW